MDKEVSEKDLYWLAGLLEGEGSFLKAPPSKSNKISIQLEMTDKDVVERAAKILQTSVYTPKIRNDYKQTYKVNISFNRAAEWMKLLFPLMGARRQQRIEECLKEYNPLKYNLNLPSKEELVEMNKVLSLRQIAAKYNCSHQTILRHIR